MLSVQTALSIQSHPDKKLAEKLHAQQPKVCVSVCVCATGTTINVHGRRQQRFGGFMWPVAEGVVIGVVRQLLVGQSHSLPCPPFFLSLPHTHTHTFNFHTTNSNTHPSPTHSTHPPSLQPQDYKDDNHKPEMALALEDFEALCGFVSPAELKAVLQEQPEVKLCVGEEAAAAFLSAEGDEQLKPVGGLGRLRVECGWGFEYGAAIGWLVCFPSATLISIPSLSDVDTHTNPPSPTSMLTDPAHPPTHPHPTGPEGCLHRPDDV